MIMTTKLEELALAIDAAKAKSVTPDVRIVYTIGVLASGDGGTGPVPDDPPAEGIPVRKVGFLATVNKLTQTYDLPDVNGTKCQLWNNNVLNESVPERGYKGMPGESDLLQREAHTRNLFRVWAWLPRQIAQKASLKQYSHPDVGTNGADLGGNPNIKGMWVERKMLTTATSDAWIEAIIAYLKIQWSLP